MVHSRPAPAHAMHFNSPRRSMESSSTLPPSIAFSSIFSSAICSWPSLFPVDLSFQSAGLLLAEEHSRNAEVSGAASYPQENINVAHALLPAASALLPTPASESSYVV